MVPLKIMSVTQRRIAPNVEVTEDVQNATAAATWIAMCVVAVDNVGTVEAKAVPAARSAAAVEGAENVAELVRLFVGIVMGLEKREILRLICMGVSSGLHAWHAMEQDTLHANTVLQLV